MNAREWPVPLLPKDQEDTKTAEVCRCPISAQHAHAGSCATRLLVRGQWREVPRLRKRSGSAGVPIALRTNGWSEGRLLGPRRTLLVQPLAADRPDVRFSLAR